MSEVDTVRELEREFGVTDSAPKRGRARKPAAKVPTNLESLIEDAYNGWAQALAWVGIFKPEDVQAVTGISPKIAAAWVRICETSQFWLRVWTRLTTGGKYGELVTLHIIMAMGFVNRRGGTAAVMEMFRAPEPFEPRPDAGGNGHDETVIGLHDLIPEDQVPRAEKSDLPPTPFPD